MTRFGWAVMALLSLALVWALVMLPEVSMRACYQSHWHRPPDLHWPKQTHDHSQWLALQ